VKTVLDVQNKFSFKELQPSCNWLTLTDVMADVTEADQVSLADE